MRLTSYLTWSTPPGYEEPLRTLMPSLGSVFEFVNSVAICRRSGPTTAPWPSASDSKSTTTIPRWLKYRRSSQLRSLRSVFAVLRPPNTYFDPQKTVLAQHQRSSPNGRITTHSVTLSIELLMEADVSLGRMFALSSAHL